MFSRQQVAELMEIKSGLAAAGVTVVAIGSGSICSSLKAAIDCF
jgi:hypothetical protein